MPIFRLDSSRSMRLTEVTSIFKASFLVPPLNIYVCVTPELSFLCEWTNLFSDGFVGSMNSGLLLTMQHCWKAVLSFNVLDIKLNKKMATNICGF